MTLLCNNTQQRKRCWLLYKPEPYYTALPLLNVFFLFWVSSSILWLYFQPHILKCEGCDT